MPTLYHYTNRAGAKGIKESKIMLKSTGGVLTDALFGPGVYFTDLDPRGNSRLDIAQDIWFDSIATSRVEEGYLNWVVEVTFKSGVSQPDPTSHPHIWLYPGKHLSFESKDVGNYVIHRKRKSKT